MTALRERLDADLKDAMRAKDQLRLDTIRAIKSAVKYKEVEGTAKSLSETAIIGVLTTLLKQRREAIDEYTKAGRTELAEKERAELSILQNYLPRQLSPEQLATAVKEAIAEAQATSVKDFGAVMKIITARLKGQAEGKAIADEVRAQLS